MPAPGSGGFGVSIAAADAITGPITEINRSISQLSKNLVGLEGTAGPTKFFNEAQAFSAQHARLVQRGIGEIGHEVRGLGEHFERAFEPFAKLTGVDTLRDMASGTGAAENINKLTEGGKRLHELALRTGETATTLYNYGAAARIAGSSTEAMNDALTTLNSTINQVNRGTANPEAAEFFQQFGIATRNFDNSGRLASRVAGDIAEVITTKIPSPQERARRLQALVGSAETLQVFTQGREGLARYLRTVEGGAGDIERFAEASERFRNAQERLRLSVEGLQKQLTTELQDALTEPMKRFSEWLAKIRETPDAMTAIKASVGTLTGVSFLALSAGLISLTGSVIALNLTLIPAAFIVATLFPEQISKLFGGLGGRGDQTVPGGGAPGGGLAGGGRLPQAALEAISRAEGTFKGGQINYNIVAGGQEIPGLTEMTISQVAALPFPDTGGLQINRSNLMPAAAALGFDPTKTKYTPEVQVAIGSWIAQQPKGLRNWVGLLAHPEEMRRAQQAITEQPAIPKGQQATGWPFPNLGANAMFPNLAGRANAAPAETKTPGWPFPNLPVTQTLAPGQGDQGPGSPLGLIPGKPLPDTPLARRNWEFWRTQGGGVNKDVTYDQYRQMFGGPMMPAKETGPQLRSGGALEGAVRELDPDPEHSVQIRINGAPRGTRARITDGRGPARATLQTDYAFGEAL